MIRTTRWHPDTCDCVIDLEWDDAVTLETRTHRVVNHRRCVAHPSAVGLLHEDDRCQPSAEGRRKNSAIAAALEHSPALRDGTPGNYALKAGIAVEWAWEGVDRRLRLTFAGAAFTAAQKAALQAAIDARVDRVVIG